ncbi:hypothetical protein C8R43DRAFT_894992, partial [Mycena crocata]
DFPTDESQRVDKTIQEIIMPLRGDVEALVSGKRGLPMWTPTSRGQFADFLSGLKLPVDADSKPDMLLHELGQLGNDLSFKKRIRGLFQGGRLRHKFLINTSGSGKTRLVFEGLCRKWGIYFTAKRDTLGHGSQDLQNIIDIILGDASDFSPRLSTSSPQDFAKNLDQNRKIAQRQFKCLILARLSIFRMFLETIERVPASKRGSDDHYRKQWLQFQIQPSILGNTHDDITSLKHSGRISRSQLDLCIEREMRYIRSQLECSTPQTEMSDDEWDSDESSSGQTKSRFTLFVVVDEVQHAVEAHVDAFRSEPKNQGDQIFPRPVFREMLHSVLGIHRLVVIAAGTGVHAAVLKETMHSAVAKPREYLPVYDIGAFEGNLPTADVSAHLEYIARFIPPELLKTPIFAALVARTCYWLRGRFRFTAGFICELLAAEYKHPHETLNEYIFQLTLPPKRQDLTFLDTLNSVFSGFVATDGAQFIDKSARVNVSKPTITRIAVNFWLRSDQENINIAQFEAEFVQWGFARFLPSTLRSDHATASMDEPMALLALGQWMNAGFSETIYHRLTSLISLHSARGENALENYLAFCFTRLFNWGSRRLDEIFHFPEGVPAWAKQTARLVSLYRQDSQTELEESSVDWWSRPSYSLGSNAHDADRTLQWLKHTVKAPICFPPNKFGPDILFTLRLEDGSRIWVAVQSKYESTTLLDAEKLVSGMRSVTPVNYWSSIVRGTHELLRLPGRRADAGTYSLLRVIVSFPGDTKVSRGRELKNSVFYHDVDKHPLASLNMQYLAAMTRNIEPKEFLTTIKNSPDFVGHKYITDDNWFQEDLWSTDVHIPGKAYRQRAKETVPGEDTDTEAGDIPGPNKRLKRDVSPPASHSGTPYAGTYAPLGSPPFPSIYTDSTWDEDTDMT